MGVGRSAASKAGALAHFFGAPFAMAYGAVVSAIFVGASRLARPAVFKADPPESGLPAPEPDRAGGRFNTKHEGYKDARRGSLANSGNLASDSETLFFPEQETAKISSSVRPS